MIAVAYKQLTGQAARARCYSKVDCYQLLKQEDNQVQATGMCEIVNGCSPADTAAAQCRELFPRAGPQLPRFNNYCGPTKGREEWFSLGENHEKVLCFGLHPIVKPL
jgi:hypothetical protein